MTNDPTRTPGSEPTDDGPLASWEALAVEAVGRVIEFWGFKRNHGRVWAFLYLRKEPRTAKDLQRQLGLSPGAVSMVTSDLEEWNVIRRAHGAGGTVRRYEPVTDFLSMVREVVRNRELPLVERVQRDLNEAADTAESDGADDEVVGRLRRMARLADVVAASLNLFVRSGRLDVEDTEDVL